MRRRGYFFTTDAFIALLVTLAIVFLLSPGVRTVERPSYLEEDILLSLTSLPIKDLESSLASTLIANGTVSDPNMSVLEQVGELYAASSPLSADLLSEAMENISTSLNYGFYFNDQQVYLSNTSSYEDADEVLTSRQILSGLSAGESVRGFSSRAFLTAGSGVEHFYFGGYVGEGNVTVSLGQNLTSLSLEAVFSGPFQVYLNNQFVGTYVPLPQEVYEMDLDFLLENFTLSENNLSFRSATPTPLSLAGGYLRMVYNESSSLSSEQYHPLPGIEGIINLYDSFYVPGELASMELFLHYNSTQEVFFTIGNTTIYQGNSSGNGVMLTFDDSVLSPLLDYDSLSMSTIPYRFGLENVSYYANITLDADVFSVTDLSGSMGYQCSVTSPAYCGGWEWGCLNWCGGSWSSDPPIDVAKDANDFFIESVLNASDNQTWGNRVGLVGYESSVSASDYHALSNNTTSLKNEVASWSEGGSTCICCGINYAVDRLQEDSSPSAFRSLVVMSDGEATATCVEQGTGDPKDDAIQAACDAYNDEGIIVYAIGFGAGADESTLQSIASCGQGGYFYGDTTELIDIYRQVAEDIIEAAYVEQTVISEDIYSVLYPDSYLFLNYTSSIPFGLAFSLESDDFGGDSETSFSIPNDTLLYEANLVSYSGSQWTSLVQASPNGSGSWSTLFNLSSFGFDYTSLGDPFLVHLPLNDSFSFDVAVRSYNGLSSSNATPGSSSNKVVYTLVRNLTSFSPIVSSAEGCIWTIHFEDATNVTMFLPSDYVGGALCEYSSSSISYNPNDAIQAATAELLMDLDLDDDGLVDVLFSEQDLSLSSVEVAGIPFTWETEVQIRLWR